MRRIKKTYSKLVISENNQNQDLETFISMKSDAGCNETTPAISFDRFHENSEILTKITLRQQYVHYQIVRYRNARRRFGFSDV